MGGHLNATIRDWLGLPCDESARRADVAGRAPFRDRASRLEWNDRSASRRNRCVCKSHGRSCGHTVRGGGHNVGGLAIQDDTLLIDLGGMRTVDVDARHRRATVAGGALWRDFDAVAGAFGLATTGGMMSTTGVGGLTLGGGIGWLVRKYGLASDNLIGAEVVLANGELVRVDEERHADLFRALRGGGAGLGVVTQFDFKLHPVSTVLAGALWCKAERAAEVLRIFR